jgi:hypothetical protein
MTSAFVRVWLVGLVLIAGCGTDGKSTEPTLGADTTDASSAEQPIETSPPSTESSSPPATQPTPPTTEPTETSPPATTEPTETSPPPTAEPTKETSPPSTAAGPTVPSGPAVFDPQTVASNLTLPSFILTVTVANTSGGQLNGSVTTSGFTKDPISVSKVASFSSDGTTDTVRDYLIDDRAYEENNFGDWYLYERGSSGLADFSDDLDLRSGTLADVLSARLDGQGEVAGIPANHFVFDETDLSYYPNYTPDNPSPDVEGDFYLAQDGNYVLFTHSKETSPDRTYEVTEALSWIGLVPVIALPPELTPMTQALDIGVNLGSLLPPGTSLLTMIRYRNGIGVDYYAYRTPVRTIDDFLNFYRTLPPTNGWTVTHIGHITPHYEQIDCETSVDCIILNNGGDQIVVSFGGGGITVEYDREHVFSPV